MNLTIERCDDDELWNSFVAASPHGNVFCTSHFLTALNEPFVRYVILADGVAYLAIPVNESGPLFVPYESYTTFRFAIYQGPMFSKEIEEMPTHHSTPLKMKLLDFALTELSQMHRRIWFTLDPQFHDVRSFQWFNYHNQSGGRFDVHLRYTGLLSLSAFDDSSYLNEIRHLRKREFFRAEKEGIVCETTEDLDVLDWLEDMVYERQSLERDPADRKARRAIAESALANNFGCCLVARRRSGEVCSAYLCLYDDLRAYYLFAGNHPDTRKTGASTMLIFHALKMFKNDSKRFFDFIGLNSPNRGDFKSSFNAVAMPYFLVNWTKPC